MSQLLETVQAAIDALVDQKDKSAIEILEELQTVQEYLERATDTVHLVLCQEE